MTPRALAEALNVERSALRKWLKPLAKAKTVVLTGSTMSRRISLAAAKEEP